MTNLDDKFSDQEKATIDAQIAEFLSKGIVSYSEPQVGQILSPIFLRRKSHALNDSVVYDHFKLDTLEATLPLITPGCYMTTLDLKDAYYSIPIAQEQQHFFTFTWKGILYQFLCLSMGLTSSLNPFSSFWEDTVESRVQAIDDSLYIDYIGDTYESSLRNTFTAVQLFISLGFQVHSKKAMVVPTKKIEYLGFVSIVVCGHDYEIERQESSCHC